jgi:hypothetical protein
MRAAGEMWGLDPDTIGLGHRRGGSVVGNRQRARDLAVALLAEPAAILAGHRDRVAALLREARVVDDLGLDPLNGRTSSHTLASTVRPTMVRCRQKCSSNWCCATHLNQGKGRGFAARLCGGRQIEARPALVPGQHGSQFDPGLGIRRPAGKDYRGLIRLLTKRVSTGGKMSFANLFIFTP